MTAIIRFTNHEDLVAVLPAVAVMAVLIAVVAVLVLISAIGWNHICKIKIVFIQYNTCERSHTKMQLKGQRGLAVTEGLVLQCGNPGLKFRSSRL